MLEAYRPPKNWHQGYPVGLLNLQYLLQDGDDKPGVMEQLRVEVCECASLYALKYEEEFAPHAPAFVAAVWRLLLNTTHAPKYDAVSIIMIKITNAPKYNYLWRTFPNIWLFLT